MLTEQHLRSALSDNTVTVVGEPGVLSRVCGFATPYFYAVGRPSEAGWRLTACVVGPEVLEAKAEDGAEPPHQASWDAAERRLTVSCSEPRWIPVFALRYLRTLTRAFAVAGGALPLHGAAVDVSGVGVILVGEKRAGKTTAALSLARSGLGRLLSNDDVLLHHDLATAQWRMAGGPRAIGIRTDSLAEHRPALSSAELTAAARRHPANRADKIFLTAAEVPALGGRTGVSAPANVVIELESGGSSPAHHEQVTGRGVADLLARHLERGADRRRLDLLAALGTPRPELTDHVVGSLISGLRCHRFRHPVHGWVEGLLEFVRAQAGAGARPGAGADISREAVSL